jgi:hypothetical protein
MSARVLLSISRKLGFEKKAVWYFGGEFIQNGRKRLPLGP